MVTKLSVEVTPLVLPFSMRSVAPETSISMQPAHFAAEPSSINTHLPSRSSAKRTIIIASYCRAMVTSSRSATGRFTPSM